MEIITSRHITQLTGVSARGLHDLCKDLGVGKTDPGVERHFDLVDASMVTLAARLNYQGLRRLEAIILASKTKADLERLIRNPEDQRCWLFASRSESPVPHAVTGRPTVWWKYQVVEGVGSPAMLADPETPGYTAVINLRAVVRDVLAVRDQAA
jgi:hypothetical protein